MGKRAKYKTGTDGRKSTSRTYVEFGIAKYTGKKIFKGHTDQEVDDKIAAFEASCNQAPAVYKKKLDEIIDEWWEKKEPKLSPNSVNSYKAKKKEISIIFGSCPVEDITSADIFDWLNGVAASGMSQRSVSDRKSVMKCILDYAIVKRVIKTNPCASVPAVKGKDAVKRPPASEEDVQKVEKLKDGDLICRMHYFMEYTGCRIGEAAVLQQKHIDRLHHKASICQDLAFDGQRPMVKPSPKTASGNRDVDLYDNVLEILPEYDDPETFIFFPEGLPRKSPYETALKHFRKEHGITSTAHQFRHTYAGIMHSAEIDAKDTQARMGHSSVQITEDIYTEIERQHNEKVRNKANKYIMEERLKKAKVSCPACGSMYTKATDGHVFRFCPDCGNEI